MHSFNLLLALVVDLDQNNKREAAAGTGYQLPRPRQCVGPGMSRALLEPAGCIDRGPARPKEHQRSSSWHGLSGVKNSSVRHLVGSRKAWNKYCTPNLKL